MKCQHCLASCQPFSGPRRRGQLLGRGRPSCLVHIVLSVSAPAQEATPKAGLQRGRPARSSSPFGQCADRRGRCTPYPLAFFRRRRRYSRRCLLDAAISFAIEHSVEQVTAQLQRSRRSGGIGSPQIRQSMTDIITPYTVYPIPGVQAQRALNRSVKDGVMRGRRLRHGLSRHSMIVQLYLVGGVVGP